MAHPVLSPKHVALITGGASGLGLAAAKAFLAYGMRVAIADLPGDKLAAAEAELGRAGVAMAVPCDVSVESDLRHLEETVKDKLGPIDVLMLNAGIQPGSDIFGPAAAWEAVLATNLMGIVRGAQIMVPGMIAAAGRAW